MLRSFDFNAVLYILAGAQWTILLSLAAFVGGGVLGLCLALARTSKWGLLRFIVAGYVSFFQGTPLLVQLFAIYFGVEFLNFEINVWSAMVIGLSLNAGAFLSEIWRGGMQAIPNGQREASIALGLKYWARMRFVILPQALRTTLPATTGYLIQLIKGTSLAGIIGITELTRSGEIISNATYQPLLAYGIVGIFYFLICWPLSLLEESMSRRTSLAG